MLKNYHISCTSFMTFLFTYFFFFQDKGIINKSIVIDSFSLGLILITIICILIITWLVRSKPESFYYSFINLFIVCVFISLYLTHNLFVFYIIFEISVLPIIFYISSWGYSLDRIKAIIYMFIYTFFFSLPFLLSILYLIKLSRANIIFSRIKSFLLNDALMIFCLTIFLVKIPVWGFHLWLPKAHVEASTEGSIILAGVVLKLAGIGLIKFSNFSLTSYHNFLIYLISSLSLVGAVAMGLYCVRQRDAKVIIALSSIVHISFLFLCYIISSSLSFFAIITVMIAHGIIRPLIFLFLGEVYNNLSRRSLLYLKGVLKNVLFLRVMWFVICIFNIGLPLSINFFGEIVFFFSSKTFSLLITLFTASLIFINGFFNRFLLIFLRGGKEKDFSFTNRRVILISIIYILLAFVVLFTPNIVEQ